MTKSTITREQRINEVKELIANAEEWAGYYEHPIHDKPQREMFEGMARVMAEHLAALTAMDSEPVAEVVSIYGDPEAFGEREIRPLVGIQQMPYGTKLYRHAQPASVVPKEMTAGIAVKHWEGGRGSIESFVAGYNFCRAAMLQASPVCTCPSGDGSLRWPCPVHPGNSPAIPDGYVMVPKEPTEAMMLHNSGCQHHAWDDPDCAMRQTRRLIWSHMLAAAPQKVK